MCGIRVKDRGRLVTLVVGGLTDNEVGFMHVREGRPPPIDPDDRSRVEGGLLVSRAFPHIWVEPVTDGWFLFRTT